MRFQTLESQRMPRALALAGCLILLTACGGGGGGTPPPPPPPAATIESFAIDLTAADVPGGSTETGTATADIDHNVTDGLISVVVTLNGVTPDSVTLNSGFAGDTGSTIHSLAQDAGGTTWSITDQVFTTADADALDAGEVHLLITTANEPDGALRGQVVPAGVSLDRIELVADQIPTTGNTAASAVAWLTNDDNAAMITLHVVTSGLDDADSASASRAIAGITGPIIESLVADTLDNSHWMLERMSRSSEMTDAIASGELYITVNTPAFPDGAIRGQVLAQGQELVVTELTAGAVVLAPKSSRSSMKPAGGDRVMTTIDANSLSSVVNLNTIANADAVELRQAPAGQNGPVIASYTQDTNDSSQWHLLDFDVNPVLAAGLGNRSLYISATTPGTPEGVARGQIETTASNEPGDASAFKVIAIDPVNAAQLEALPDTIFVTLSREPLVSSVTIQAVGVELSGGDGSFGDGNESNVTPSSLNVDGNTIEIDLAGIAAEDDVYRTVLRGGGTAGIVDQSGIALDGNDDGQPGGDYEAAFEVQVPEVDATLTKIQDEIFTPSCATSGCHSGTNPPDGLNLAAGNSYANTVGVTAVQMPSLMLIEPGDPDNSYLVRKIEGSGIVANRMPLGGAPLSSAQIDLVRQWVVEGALDN